MIANLGHERGRGHRTRLIGRLEQWILAPVRKMPWLSGRRGSAPTLVDPGRRPGNGAGGEANHRGRFLRVGCVTVWTPPWPRSERIELAHWSHSGSHGVRVQTASAAFSAHDTIDRLPRFFPHLGQFSCRHRITAHRRPTSAQRVRRVAADHPNRWPGIQGLVGREA